MGFLKRLFSVGSKKSKKQRAEVPYDAPPIPELPPFAKRTMDEQETEAEVGRLLRSTSARVAERSELTYAMMPPLPHPINNVIQTPASSAISLASTSLSQRSTYNVTVHQRKRHASTEFPLANRGLEHERTSSNRDGHDLTTVEDSRMLRLRSDPSVTSLLELYDEHGKLSNDAFSNSPPPSPKEGRAQCRRSGSTLRQLLGAPLGGASDNSEGDISWAERYLAETEATSSKSSLDIQTPVTPQFEEYTRPEISFVSDADISVGTYDNPAISSMEVEINNSQDVSQDFDEKYQKNSPYMHNDPSTPQRASQVFGFLTKKSNLDRTLPELPSCFSSPSDENGDARIDSIPDDSMDFSFAPTRFSAMPMPLIHDTPRNTHPRSSIIENTPIPSSRVSQVPRSAFSDDSHDYHLVSQNPIHVPATTPPPNVEETRHNDIKVLMTGPTKVILTSATPSSNPLHNGPSRLPRGPRSHRKTSSGSSRRRRSVLGEVSSNAVSTGAGDPFVIVTSKPRPLSPHKRSNSTASVDSTSRRSYTEHTDTSNGKKNVVASPTVRNHKENQLGLSVKNEIPATPLRSAGSTSRSLFRTAIQQSAFLPPAPPSLNPNSSSDLSPLGRQIMLDARKQRMRARDSERAKGKNRF